MGLKNGTWRMNQIWTQDPKRDNLLKITKCKVWSGWPHVHCGNNYQTMKTRVKTWIKLEGVSESESESECVCGYLWLIWVQKGNSSKLVKHYAICYGAVNENFGSLCFLIELFHCVFYLISFHPWEKTPTHLLALPHFSRIVLSASIPSCQSQNNLSSI